MITTERSILRARSDNLMTCDEWRADLGLQHEVTCMKLTESWIRWIARFQQTRGMGHRS
jgi:hypothetical protein